MSDEERVHDLEQIRADGWFERVISGVPALERLCESLGEPLVALSLAAGFRVMSASVDRGTGEVNGLTWVRDQEGGGEITGSGSSSMFRTEVLAALLSDADPTAPLGNADDPAEVRAFIGQRYLLLSPLFGLTLRQLLVPADDEARVVVFHDGIEETVPLKQLRRFLRARVVDALNAARGRNVSIDLEQAAQARAAFDEGRYDEVVAKLSGWVAPLMMYQRTPEGSSLDPVTRADISRALGVLGRTFFKLGRPDESEETLRLAVQYAHDSPAAAEIYRMLARTMIDGERYGQAIGPLRRSLVIEPESVDCLTDLAKCFVQTNRAVAAYGCIQKARSYGNSSAQLDAAEAEVRAALGSAVEKFETVVAEGRRLK